MTTFTVETVDPQHAAVVRAAVPMAALREFFDRGFTAVMQAVQSQGVAIVGSPFGYYPSNGSTSLAQASEPLMSWTIDEGLALAEAMWESYLSDPRAEPDPNTWRTLIVWPLDASRDRRTATEGR
jgi:hypothetical protein